jgi:hypothetical protein
MNKEEIQAKYNLACAQLGDLRFKRHAFDKLIASKLLEIESLEEQYGLILRSEKEAGQTAQDPSNIITGAGE